MGGIPYRWYAVHEPHRGRIDLFDTDGYSPDERGHGILLCTPVPPLHIIAGGIFIAKNLYEVFFMKNVFNVKRMVTMAAFAAISIVLVLLIHFPIFPAVGFLEYDPADIPILLCTFMFGPVYGIVLTVIVSILQGITVSAASGIYGIIMHIIATSAYVLVAGFIYKRHRTFVGAIIALICGMLAMTAIMIPANLFITPIFMGVPRQAVIDLLGFIIAFNAIKAGINGVVTFLVYKPLRKLLKTDS